MTLIEKFVMYDLIQLFFLFLFKEHIDSQVYSGDNIIRIYFNVIITRLTILGESITLYYSQEGKSRIMC